MYCHGKKERKKQSIQLRCFKWTSMGGRIGKRSSTNLDEINELFDYHFCILRLSITCILYQSVCIRTFRTLASDLTFFRSLAIFFFCLQRSFILKCSCSITDTTRPRKNNSHTVNLKTYPKSFVFVIQRTCTLDQLIAHVFETIPVESITCHRF